MIWGKERWDTLGSNTQLQKCKTYRILPPRTLLRKIKQKYSCCSTSPGMIPVFASWLLLSLYLRAGCRHLLVGIST